jgi:hypothetical protein
VVAGGGDPTPTPTLQLTAELLDQDVAVVEAGVAGVEDAYATGDLRTIGHALAGQAALLEALGVKFLRIAGQEPKRLQQVQVYANLAFRALDGARKALTALADLRGGPKSQMNMQINVGTTNG